MIPFRFYPDENVTSGKFSKLSIIQPDLNYLSEINKASSVSLAAGIVLSVDYADELTNSSALRNVGSLSTTDASESNLKKYLNDEQIFSNIVGNKIECDVLIYHYLPGRLVGFVVKDVPVLQQGGIHDFSLWVPRGTSNWDGAVSDFDLMKLDGDHVLVGFVADMVPQGSIILGSIPHPLNKRDAPRSIYGTFGIPKEPNDGKRKDGRIFYFSKNGTITKVDLHGNICIDTTQADRSISVDLASTNQVIKQSNTDWTSNKNTAPMDGDPEGDYLPFDDQTTGSKRKPIECESPGGGDIDLHVKNSRKVKLAFFDNSVSPVNSENPPIFRETGFLQITNNGTERELDICLSDSVKIRIRKFGGKAATFTIDTDDEQAAIILGSDVEQLANKSFVEEVFLKHNHTTIVSGAPLITEPIILWEDKITPILGPVQPDGTLISPQTKIATSKTKAE